MTSAVRRRLCLFVGFSCALLCLRASFLLSGGRSSSRRNQQPGRNATGPSRQSQYRGAIPGLERPSHGLNQPVIPQLPSKLTYTRLDRGPVLEEAVRAIPGTLSTLQYSHATAAVHELKVKDLKKANAAILDQMQTDQSRKQFLPLVTGTDVNVYATPVRALPRTQWPSKLGEYAGDGGITKAVIFGVARPDRTRPNLRAITIHGVARITNAPDLHEPPQAVRQMLHDVHNMLYFR